MLVLILLSLSPGLSTCVLLEVVAILLQLRQSVAIRQKSCFWTSYVIRGSWQKNGVTLFGVGELGNGKHDTGSGKSSSTITGQLEEVVGIGANLPTDKLANKIDVVRRAITLNDQIRRMALMSWQKWVDLIWSEWLA